VRDKKLTRRDFIKGAALTSAGLVLGSNLLAKLDALAQEGKVYLPLILKAPEPPPARVVHVHDNGATNWNGGGWYGAAVSQTVVDTMVQQGLQNLTTKSSWTEIWNGLFSQVQPSCYQVGQKIAIKVNFNNSNEGCGDSDNEVDALPQPVKALIRGLTLAGVQQQDIWIYDASRRIPDRFRIPILNSYPNVVFYGGGSCTGVNEATFNHIHASLEIQFSDPGSNLSNRWLPDLLYQATYLINMPILKKHGIHPVTLSFKNHFGSLDNIIRPGNDNLHYYIRPSDSLYRSDYSPLVDIYSNSNIKDKTILTVGDGLFGATGATGSAIQVWPNTFGDAANSLFFSTHPVAIDCVMCDFLDAEWGIDSAAYDYLFTSQDAGLGVCEGDRSNPGGDPWGSGYNQIDYVRILPP
jgi:hypothetical protein